MSAVDVDSVLEQAIRREQEAGQAYVAQVAARAAVAELIKCDREYDDALAALADLNRRVAEQGWIDIEFDALRKAANRVCRAKNFRALALERVQGGAQ